MGFIFMPWALRTRERNLVLYRTQGPSWLAEKYLASQDGFYYKERIIEWSGVICFRRPPNIILLDVSEQPSDPTKACRQFGVFIQGSALMKIFEPNTTNTKIETNQSSSLNRPTVAHLYPHSILSMSVDIYTNLLWLFL
jgi:hypothetical protein